MTFALIFISHFPPPPLCCTAIVSWPLSHGHSDCEHKNRSENIRIYPDHPQGKRDFILSLTHRAAFPLMAFLFQIGLPLSSKFYFKRRGPTVSHLTLTPLPRLSSLQPLDIWWRKQTACQVVLWLKLKTKEKTCHAVNGVFLLLCLLVW